MDQPTPPSVPGSSCPLPFEDHAVVEVAHGGGGRRTHELIRSVFLEAFGDPLDARGHDGAVFEAGPNRLAFTTDAYVVDPIEFPGGDIGALAVHGTVNDLLMCGARPMHLSASFVLETGLRVDTLWRIARSMRRAADDAGVRIVTGDTKVIEAARSSGLFVTTSGIGAVEAPCAIGPASVRPGCSVLLSGDIGRHGIAVMAARERLALEPPIRSDSAPLNAPVLALMERGIGVRCLRDLTRGGLASALVEIASTAGVDISIDERLVPVRDDIRAVCELLGLDPLHVANEGRFIAILDDAHTDRALEVMRGTPVASGACVIGHVLPGSGRVSARTPIGTDRSIHMLSGEQLPRIC